MVEEECREAFDTIPSFLPMLVRVNTDGSRINLTGYKPITLEENEHLFGHADHYELITELHVCKLNSDETDLVAWWYDAINRKTQEEAAGYQP